MESLWNQEPGQISRPSLRGDIQTDVLVIGGGMAGILCAYELNRRGIDTVVAEARRIGGGVTSGTTAKITSQHGLLYHSLIHRFGRAFAAAYLQANQKALARFRELAADVDCDFEEQTAYLYSRVDSEMLLREVQAVNSIGGEAKLFKRLSLPFAVSGAIGFSNQAQFHPLKFLKGISKDLCIYENTPVQELIGLRARTDRGSITAKKIIVATHFPFLNKHGSYFLKLYQQRSYVIALENADLPTKGMYLDQADNGLSFRRQGSYLLLGGGGHRTGKGGGGWQALSRFISQAYPSAKEAGRWATQDCMTLDGVPYIGQYSKRTPDLFAATGFNKWGMTSSMVAAQLLADLIEGKENPYAKLFSPSRSILRPQLAVNAAEAVVGLLSPAKRRCPHLGCALKWNPQEHTWDCPCHGSRFTENGELLDNPATGDLLPK